MAKEPAKRKSTPEQRSDEYDNFEQAVRRVLTVPKRDLDEAVERERQARQNGNGAK